MMRWKILDDNVTTRLEEALRAGPKNILEMITYSYPMGNEYSRTILHKITNNDIINGNNSQAYYHFAVIMGRLASCVTYNAPQKMSHGYGVGVSKQSVKMLSRVHHIVWSLTQPEIWINVTNQTDVFFFAYNEKQESE